MRHFARSKRLQATQKGFGMRQGNQMTLSMPRFFGLGGVKLAKLFLSKHKAALATLVSDLKYTVTRLVPCYVQRVVYPDTNTFFVVHRHHHLSSFGERLPSADRSQSILNSAGRHRDSAARLC
jgi:hypothetical protein